MSKKADNYVVPEALVKVINDSFQGFQDHVDEKFARVDARFDDLEAKLTARIDAVERKLSARMDHLERRLDALVDEVSEIKLRLQKIESRQELRALDKRLARVEVKVGLRRTA